MIDLIHIKPHHFVDILTYYGAGQATFAPHPYGHAQHTVAAQLHANPDILIEIELVVDDICAPRVHNQDGECDDIIDIQHRPQAPPLKREWNLLIDLRWCERLGLSQGDRLSAHSLAQRLLQKMGDITDIYREMPADGTAQRSNKLRNGLSQYLRGS